MAAPSRLAGPALVALATAAAVFAPAVASPVPEPPGPPATLVFYAHWRDIVNRAPLNLVPPTPQTDRDLNQGFNLPTVVAKGPCGDPCSVNFRNNVFTLFTQPGPHHADPNRAANYDTRDPVYAVRIADGPIILYAYLSAHPVPTQNSTTPLGPATNAGGMPLVQADVVWETGREPYKGVVIARGLSPTVNMVHLPGPDAVYELAIPMGRFLDAIPPGEGTLLTVRLTQVATDNAEVLQSNWRLRSGPAFPWRLIVPVEDPLQSRPLRTDVIDDALHVRWGVRAAWGAYDVDMESMRLKVWGDDGSGPIEFAADGREPSPYHDAHLRTVYVNWAIPFERLPRSSTWHVRVEASNLQGTFQVVEAHAQAANPYEGANTPGPAFALAALAVVGLAAALRRRP